MAAKTMRRAGASLILAVTLMLSLALTAPAAHATVKYPAMSSSTLGDRVLNKAETKAWHWYSYGSAGPTYFDCSGIVYWAAGQLGVSLPRTTYGMLVTSKHLYRVALSSARRGDLMFYGSGHVEINTGWYHTTFGAHHPGTQLSWRSWNGYYAPTMVMRLR